MTYLNSADNKGTPLQIVFTAGMLGFFSCCPNSLFFGQLTICPATRLGIF